jgi:hypothetical protein
MLLSGGFHSDGPLDNSVGKPSGKSSRFHHQPARAPSDAYDISAQYPTYNFFLPAALTFAHLALAAAESFALAAALILPLALGARLTATFFPFTFAHLALAAAESFALAAALILNFFFGAAATADFVEEPKIRPSSFSSD